MPNQLVLFDYNGLDAETRIVVQQRTGEIRDLMRNTAENIMRVGQKLLEVQVKLGNGQFDAWLQTEFDWSRRTAYNFIGVYKKFEGRADFSQIDISTSALYLLSAPSTPESAVEAVIDRAEAGERISHTTAKEVVADHKTKMKPELPLMEEVRQPVARTEAARRQPQPEPDEAEEEEDYDSLPWEAAEEEPETAPAISLDFSSPAAQPPPPPAEVVLTVRMSRAARGQPPATVQLEINAADGLMHGRFPDFYQGDYANLPALVEQACRRYFESETEDIRNE